MQPLLHGGALAKFSIASLSEPKPHEIQPSFGLPDESVSLSCVDRTFVDLQFHSPAAGHLFLLELEWLQSLFLV